jgi:PAT family beta-lactamase induction signal transducer AmpG
MPPPSRERRMSRMDAATPARTYSGWRWIPSLYFAEGIPYVAVMTLSVVMYKNLGISNTDIALYTSWLNLPWVLKPLWSPVLDLFGSKRRWVFLLQFLVGAALACVALAVPASRFFQLTLAVFWLIAFSSATHDIAADGFYMLAQPPHLQAAFVGVRNTAYKLAMIAGQGGVVYAVGALQESLGNPARAWSYAFLLIAAVFVLAAAYHAWALPRPASDRPDSSRGAFVTGFGSVFVEFFRRPDLGRVLAFLLLYRFAEAQFLKLVTPFLLDPRSAGGLGVSTKQYAFVYGTVGVIALLTGGIVGGLLASRYGLKRMLWPMIVTMHLPNLVFVLLAFTQPANLYLIGSGLVVEQFGYGFGFTAYMLYMIYVARGRHQTAHYAICTGFMALGLMLPGMAAGWIQDHLGYPKFFLYVCLATLPSFAAAAFVKIDPAFGRKG